MENQNSVSVTLLWLKSHARQEFVVEFEIAHSVIEDLGGRTSNLLIRSVQLDKRKGDTYRELTRMAGNSMVVFIRKGSCRS